MNYFIQKTCMGAMLFITSSAAIGQPSFGLDGGLEALLGITPGASSDTEMVVVEPDPAEGSAESPKWSEQREDGWFWYVDPVIPDEEPVGAPEVVLMPEVGEIPADPLAELQALQRKIEEAKALAVLHPTTEHVQNWLELQQAIQNRSVLFADVAKRTIWQNAKLNVSRQRPPNPQGLAVYNASRIEAKNQALREIASTHGLFFFFRGDCAYCHRLAPFLKRFANTYGFKIVPMSLDGDEMPAFPNARYEPQVARNLNVQTVPAIFLVNPNAETSDKAIQPVSYGFVGLSELEDRIYKLMVLEPGKPIYTVPESPMAEAQP